MLMVFTCLSTKAFFPKQCANSDLRGDEVISWRFENCVNDNFWQIEARLGSLHRFDRCQAFPRSRVGFSYERCINDNFRKVEFAEPRVFIQHCHNFGARELSPRFLKCINRNFKDIEQFLRFR
jgi:hypothetical protein